jgi:hypothetical protein
MRSTIDDRRSMFDDRRYRYSTNRISRMMASFTTWWWYCCWIVAYQVRYLVAYSSLTPPTHSIELHVTTVRPPAPSFPDLLEPIRMVCWYIQYVGPSRRWSQSANAPYLRTILFVLVLVRRRPRNNECGIINK